MKLTLGTLLLCAGLLLAGCAAQKPAAPSGTLEPLISHRWSAKGLTIEVMSNGCTSKESFDFRLQPADGQPQLIIYRRKPDYCKAMPRPLLISISYADLGLEKGQQVTLANPRK